MFSFLAKVAWAGSSIDGPHGGLRNVSGKDEQFLVFNVFNAAALRDNIRESAAELALFADVVAPFHFDAADCPGPGGGGPGPGEVRFDAAHLALMGHSMGATISLLTAGVRTDLVNGLALLEPVVLPAAGYAVAQLPLGPQLQRIAMPLAVGAAKRRNEFASREEAVAAFTGRGIFKAFPPEVIADYVGDGLIEDGKGGFKLACAPAFEAATYTAQRHDPWGAMRKVTDPMVMLRASHGSTISEASMHRMAAIKADARVGTVEGASHMLPMERPDRARAAIETAALLARAGRKYHDALVQ